MLNPAAAIRKDSIGASQFKPKSRRQSRVDEDYVMADEQNLLKRRSLREQNIAMDKPTPHFQSNGKKHNLKTRLSFWWQGRKNTKTGNENAVAPSNIIGQTNNHQSNPKKLYKPTIMRKSIALYFFIFI